MTSGTKTDLTADWDYTVNEIAWNPDGKSLCFIAHKDGVTPVFTISTESREVSEIANGVCDYSGLNIAGDGTVFTRRHAMTYPNEICSVVNGEVKQLTNVNTELLGSLKMPTVEKKMVPTTDGKEMLVWVVYPRSLIPTRNIPRFSTARVVRSRLSASSGAHAGTLPSWPRTAISSSPQPSRPPRFRHRVECPDFG